jgi:hypothetical protein
LARAAPGLAAGWAEGLSGKVGQRKMVIADEPCAFQTEAPVAEPFLRAMRRRLDRDCGPVHEHHADLRRSALSARTSLQSAGEKAEADRKRESLRVAAIDCEYAAKLDDLRYIPSEGEGRLGAGACPLRPRAPLRGPDQAAQGRARCVPQFLMNCAWGTSELDNVMS